MSELIIGTEQGVFALHPDRGKLHPEDGPGAVLSLARAQDGLYALTPQGAVWQRQGHNDWKVINEQAVEEEVWSFGADPRVPGLLYIGVSPAMLYRSADGGRTWSACESIRSIPGYDTWSFPPPPHIPHIRSIAADPAEPGAVFIGVEEGGIYRSADGGASWDSLNEGLYWDVHVVLPGPDRERLYATTGAGFHRSDDGGRLWRHIENGLDRSYTIPLTALTSDQRTLLTAAAEAPPPSWRANGTANAAMFRSDNGGDSWERLETGLPRPFTAMVRSIASGDGLVCAGAGGSVFTSEDNGDHWNEAAKDLPIIRSLALA